MEEEKSVNIQTETKRYAVVTGANKGIGLEICKKLASNGVTVVLTARDEKKGVEALENFKGSDLSDLVVFHQLDVVDPLSVASLAEFVKSQFGRLDILVNNAGIGGMEVNGGALVATQVMNSLAAGEKIKWNEIMVQTYDSAIQCMQTNYYGTKRMIEAFIPLLQLSDSSRIVNISSSTGSLKNIPEGWAKGILSNAQNETEERVDEVVKEFLNDFKENTLQAKGWPVIMSAYTISKAAMNAYTRILAKKYPTFCINCVSPGFVKTDINYNMGVMTPEEGARGPAKVALLPSGGPSGVFFDQEEVSSF